MLRQLVLNRRVRILAGKTTQETTMFIAAAAVATFVSFVGAALATKHIAERDAAMVPAEA